MIKNRKFVHAHVFVWALLLTLLFSSMMGTTVWAKPDKPGKPLPPEPEIAEFKIWIGIGELDPPEDIVLRAYGDPPTQDYLVVENVEGSGGYWAPLPTKGKVKTGDWGVSLLGWEEDYCGTYDINNAELTDALTGYPIDDEADYYFGIYHFAGVYWEGKPTQMDYWKIIIQWELGPPFPPHPEDPLQIERPHLLTLWGDTNTGPEWEGEYDESTDTWTVYFNDTMFWVIESTESGESVELWTGLLSFTVETKRTLGTS